MFLNTINLNVGGPCDFENIVFYLICVVIERSNISSHRGGFLYVAACAHPGKLYSA